MIAISQIYQLYHLDQLIQLLGDLLDFRVTGGCGQRQSRQRFILGGRYCQRLF